MAIQEADDDDQEDEDPDEALAEDTNSNMSWTTSQRNIRIRSDKKNITWVGEAIKDDGRKIYYRYIFCKFIFVYILVEC